MNTKGLVKSSVQITTNNMGASFVVENANVLQITKRFSYSPCVQYIDSVEGIDTMEL